MPIIHGQTVDILALYSIIHGQTVDILALYFSSAKIREKEKRNQKK